MKNTGYRMFAVALTALAFCSALAQTRVIAHRGYWKTAGAAQNSVAALLKADSIGCYGSEFDVWITKDNKLIVNHDPDIQGVSIEKNTRRALTALKLANGESVPTLEKYLKAAKTSAVSTKLILELKHHSTPERETLAVEKILKMVRKYRLEARTEYITFSLHAMKELIRLAPKGTPVYYLNGELSPEELKALGGAGADYHFNVFKKHPEWIDECHRLGLKVNVWTVNNTAIMRRFVDKADFITTNEPVQAMKIINEAGK